MFIIFQGKRIMVNIQSQFTQSSYLDGVHHRSIVYHRGTVPSSYQFTSRFRIQEPEPHLWCWYGSNFFFLLKLWNTAIKQTCHMSNNFQSTEYTTDVQDKNTTKRKLMKKKTNYLTLDVENRRIVKKAQITIETSNSF